MQHPIVKKLFCEQAKYYSEDSQTATTSPIISIFLNWSKEHKGKLLKVCEFGGASGKLLNSIQEKTKLKMELYNAEIIEDYRQYQVSSKIKFYLASILDSKFPDNYFDCIIIRDVLHHLIGRNLEETIKNQKKALCEIKRITKPNGIILIEEMVCANAVVARILYWLSKINTKIGIRSDFFEISPYTVVSFLTINELEKMVKEMSSPQKIIKKSYIPTNEKWLGRLTHLGSDYGKLILAFKP